MVLLIIVKIGDHQEGILKLSLTDRLCTDVLSLGFDYRMIEFIKENATRFYASC